MRMNEKIDLTGFNVAFLNDISVSHYVVCSQYAIKTRSFQIYLTKLCVD